MSSLRSLVIESPLSPALSREGRGGVHLEYIERRQSDREIQLFVRSIACSLRTLSLRGRGLGRGGDITHEPSELINSTLKTQHSKLL